MNRISKLIFITFLGLACSMGFAAQDYNSSRSNKEGNEASKIETQVSKLVKQAQQDIVRKMKADNAKRARTDSFFDIHVEIKVTVKPNDRVVRKKPGRTK